MYFVAVRRDFQDQTAIAEFARDVQIATGCATLPLDDATFDDEPDLYDVWKSLMLEELFEATTSNS